jgi:hypothetical protein
VPLPCASEVHFTDGDVYRNGFGLVFENDMFNRMDWHFSNGIDLSYIHPAFRKSPFNSLLIPVQERTGDRPVYGLRLRQEIYTPRDLIRGEIQKGDHPYAAVLGLEEFRILNRPEDGWRFTTGLQIGVIGPIALGFQAQDFIHRITPSEPPKGWENQIGNDLLLNYSFNADREWVGDEVSQLILHGRARLGTLHTDAALGLRSRFERLPKFFRHAGPDPGRKVNFYASLNWELQFIGYDASLQGGLFNRTSPYTIPAAHVSRIVGGFDASAVVEIYGHSVGIYQHVVSPRFHHSGWHAWVGICYRYWY